MNDFSDAMVETPNTAMIIEPAAAPSYGPTDDGPGAPGEDPSTYTQSDDHNPVGVSGAFEGVTTTGCGYNVLNHGAVRAIDDIVVPGCIGKYPLKMTRYFVSRGFGILGGLGPGWRHEYSWSGGNGKFEYPNGNVWDSTCAGQLAPPGPFGVSDWPGNGGFRLADGGTVRFDQYGRANQIIDPYGQTTTIAYADNANPPTMRVTEPGSRYLLFTYGTTQNGGGRLLSKVEAYDGRGHLIDSVTYHYTSVSPGGRNPQPLKCLTRVDYSDSNPNNLNDSTHAHYTYTEDNVPDRPDLGSSKLFPLVLGCDDVRYNGPMRRIAYLYQTQAAPHGAILQERYWDGFPGHEGNGPMVSGIDPPASSPLVQDVNFETIYTETRGDGPTRKFTYSPLHITRSHDVAEPCPTASPASPAQQFLQSYTDFATPPKTTQLGYDNNWYVNSVTDANLHTTLYTRGDPPSGGGIGEIKKITHSDGSYIDYAYSDTGHYLTSVTFTSAVGELRNQTIHTRDPYTHLITRTDYRGENSSLLAYEEFTWCDAAHADPQCGGHAFGQLKTHHLKNGAYVHYRYDPRGLLIDKWEPTWNPSASEAEPKTHYDYYSSGPWTDRVMAVTGPPPNWTYSQQAAETYEYDLKSDGSRCAGRGLVTKITHADGKYQSFQYNQWGNKVNEWNETGERTQYAYDDYNRATNVTKYMYNYNNERDEITNYTYNPTNGSPYSHITNSPDTITSPSNILTGNVYDENFRKTSTSVAGRITWFHYDAVGNQDYVTDPRGTGLGDSRFTTYTDYDVCNRKWRVREPLNRTTWFEYGDSINVTKIHRTDGTVEERTYDGMNRLRFDTVPKTTSESITTELQYYPWNGNPTDGHSGSLLWKVIDGETHTCKFEYNASGLKTKMTYPDSAIESWAYDDAHNMKTRTTVGGKTQDFGWDNRGRNTGRMWEHAIGGWIIFGYDGASRVRRARNGGWDGNSNSTLTSDVHRDVDHAGRIILDRQAVTGLETKDVNYQYDVVGLRASAGNPTRMWITNQNGNGLGHDYGFRYDDMGRFEKILNAGSLAFQYSYDPASNETQRHNNLNGVDQLYDPDALNRARKVELQLNGSRFALESYGYYDIGRLQTVTRGNKQDQFDYYMDGELRRARYGVSAVDGPDPGATPPADSPTKEKTVDDFLTKPDGMDPTVLDTTQRTVTYIYDKAGNRQSVTDRSVLTSYTLTPSNLNQYDTITASTIHNGLEHEVDRYRGPNDVEEASYHYLNDEHLISVTTPTKSYQLDYDGFGRCVKRTLNVPGQATMTTFYIYDGDRPVMEYRLNDLTHPAKNLYGKGVDEILMRYDPTLSPERQTFYYQQDHEGSVTHLTKPDGTVLEKYKYDVFGAPTILDPDGVHVRPASIVSNRFMFTGREYSGTFGFYEYRARAYNPTMGRFMSEDPKGFEAGDYNLFRYCHNDPIDMTDPMGLQDQNYAGLAPREVSRVLAEITNAERISLWQKSMESSIGGEAASNTLSVLAAVTSAHLHSSVMNGREAAGLRASAMPQGTSGSTVAFFSRQAQQIVVTLPNGDTLIYPAANNTLNPCGDPHRVDSNGPAPNGTFPMQRAIPMGDQSYGPYFYPIGSVGQKGERLDIARQRGIGLHAGRDNYLHPTHGCIRMNNRDISDLHNQTQNAPLQVITIGD